MPIENYDCTYCGMMANARDHIIPHSFIKGTEQTREFSRDTTVPACTECNSLLSNLMYTTIASRAAYLVNVLRIKYKALLKSPDWSEDEYEELSGNLLKEVRHKQTKKKIIQARIAYAEGISLLEKLTPANVWFKLPPE
jgi:hypothetical protein